MRLPAAARLAADWIWKNRTILVVDPFLIEPSGVSHSFSMMT
jgi:hypothetical protein